MRPRRLAVIGFGRLGRACAEAIMATDDLRLAGLVRRAGSLAAPLPAALQEVPVSADIEELDAVDAALLCLPPQLTAATAHDLLQHRLPIVECAALDEKVAKEARERLDRLAQRHHVPAVLGAGWDPGALTLLRGLFSYGIIYGLVEDVRAALSDLLPPAREERLLGAAEVRQVFSVTGAGKIAGCMVSEGLIRRGAEARLIRDAVIIHRGRIKSLRRFKEDALEVRAGYECGLALEGCQDIRVGDRVECYAVEEVARSLPAAA
jgi:hypothetical protein